MRFSFWPNPSQSYADVLMLLGMSNKPAGTAFGMRITLCQMPRIPMWLARSLDDLGRHRRSGAATADWHLGQRQYLPTPSRAGKNGRYT
ncbi:MAG: hypothetical protein CM15mP120_01630 [Pseudomonadota bacterium]|nr:MAG: hypothetical protein CM15mP120_01630 [Pseudomonadota bacterium]